jgi:hypothetical protein
MQRTLCAGLPRFAVPGRLAPLAERHQSFHALARHWNVVDRITNGRRPKLLGTSGEVIDCNGNLWLENARDGYHASLPHTFLQAFGS